VGRNCSGESLHLVRYIPTVNGIDGVKGGWLVEI